MNLRSLVIVLLLISAIVSVVLMFRATSRHDYDLSTDPDDLARPVDAGQHPALTPGGAGRRRGRIQLLVLDEETDRPVGGAQCTVASASIKWGQSRTAADGTVVITAANLPESVTVMTVAPGYLQDSRAARTDGGMVTIRLSRSLSLAGAVVETGSGGSTVPVPQAQVYLHWPQAEYDTVTGVDGKFAFSGVPARGRGILIATKAGYESARVSLTQLREDELRHIDLRLVRKARCEIAVSVAAVRESFKPQAVWLEAEFSSDFVRVAAVHLVRGQGVLKIDVPPGRVVGAVRCRLRLPGDPVVLEQEVRVTSMGRGRYVGRADFPSVQRTKLRFTQDGEHVRGSVWYSAFGKAVLVPLDAEGVGGILHAPPEDDAAPRGRGGEHGKTSFWREGAVSRRVDWQQLLEPTASVREVSLGDGGGAIIVRAQVGRGGLLGVVDRSRGAAGLEQFQLGVGGKSVTHTFRVPPGHYAVTLDGAEVSDFDFSVSEGGVTEYDLESLHGACSISGEIHSAAPVRITVHGLRPGGTRGEVVSSSTHPSSGRFRVGGLEQGEYLLCVEFSPQARVTRRVALVEGQDFDAGDLRQADLVRTAVRLVDRQGLPMLDVRLYISDGGMLDGSPTRLRTDAEGSVELWTSGHNPLDVRGAGFAAVLPRGGGSFVVRANDPPGEDSVSVSLPASIRARGSCYWLDLGGELPRLERVVGDGQVGAKVLPSCQGRQYLWVSTWTGMWLVRAEVPARARATEAVHPISVRVVLPDGSQVGSYSLHVQRVGGVDVSLLRINVRDRSAVDDPGRAMTVHLPLDTQGVLRVDGVPGAWRVAVARDGSTVVEREE